MWNHSVSYLFIYLLLLIYQLLLYQYYRLSEFRVVFTVIKIKPWKWNQTKYELPFIYFQYVCTLYFWNKSLLKLRVKLFWSSFPGPPLCWVYLMKWRPDQQENINIVKISNIHTWLLGHTFHLDLKSNTRCIKVPIVCQQQIPNLS